MSSFDPEANLFQILGKRLLATEAHGKVISDL